MLIRFLFLLFISSSFVISESNAPPIRSIIKNLYRSYHKSSKRQNHTQISFQSQEEQNFFELVEILRSIDFFGSWHSTDSKNPPLSFFSQDYGYFFTESLQAVTELTKIRFRQALESEDFRPNELVSGSDYIDILIKLFDGKYIDEKSANLYFYITSKSFFIHNSTNSTLSISNIYAQLELKELLDSDSKLQSCLSNISIYFLNAHDFLPLNPRDIDPEDISIQVEILSDDCQLRLLTNALNYKPDISMLQILEFMILICGIGICHCFAAQKMNKSLRTRKSIYQISIMSIWLIASTDYYLLITNLVLSFAVSAIFIIPVCVFLLLNFHYERELIIKIADTRRRRTNTNDDDDWRGCGLSFALSSVIFLVELIGVIMGKLWIIQLSSLIYVPQILHNHLRKKKFNINKYYIFLFGLPRLFVILYIKGYPDNILKITPDYLFVGIYCSSIIIQILFIIMQNKFPCISGLPNFKIGPQCNKNQEEICAICYETLIPNNTSHLNSSQNYILTQLEIRFTEKEIIQTSCGHIFHIRCLMEWAKLKSICPMCREDIDDLLEEFEDESELSATS